MHKPSDIMGNPYALVSETAQGDYVTTKGFICIPDGKRRKVNRSRSKKLYLLCSHGRHYLDGQMACRNAGQDCDIFYLGVYKCT